MSDDGYEFEAFAGFDEDDLLQWVEGTIEPDRRRALQARLHEHPAVRAALDEMAGQRRTLRQLDEPALTRDLVADLESQLARPMLMEPLPATRGAYRRRQARRRRAAEAPRLVLAVARRLAIAAVFVGAIGAGAWAVFQYRPWDAPEERPRADGAGSATGPVNRVALDQPPAWPDGALVHHAVPLPGTIVVPLPRDDTPAPPAAEPVFVAAAFRLEIAATETDAEALVTAHLSDPEHAAFVRNYTQDEADVLLAQLLALPRASRQTPLFAGLSEQEVERRLELPRERNRALGDWMRRASTAEREKAGETIRSARLLGPRELAPSYEAQLEMSEAGATHAMTVRVAELGNFLAELQRDAAPVRLRMNAADSDAKGGWVEQLPALMAWWRDVRNQGDRYVIVPLVVQERGHTGIR